MAEQAPARMMTVLGLLPGGDLGPWTIYRNKRGLVVWFKKAPPLAPPTDKQLTQRNQFRIAAMCWKALSPEQRAQWELAARRTTVCMNGYDLYIHFALNPKDRRKETLQRQTGTVLA